MIYEYYYYHHVLRMRTLYYYYSHYKRLLRKVINDLVHLNDQLYFPCMDCYFMDDNDPMQDEVDLDCFLVMEPCKSSRYMFRAPNYRKSMVIGKIFLMKVCIMMMSSESTFISVVIVLCSCTIL